MGRRRTLTQPERVAAVAATRTAATELAVSLDEAATQIRESLAETEEFPPPLAASVAEAFERIDAAAGTRAEIARHLTGVIPYKVIAMVVGKNETWVSRQQHDARRLQ